MHDLVHDRLSPYISEGYVPQSCNICNYEGVYYKQCVIELMLVSTIHCKGIILFLYKLLNNIFGYDKKETPIKKQNCIKFWLLSSMLLFLMPLPYDVSFATCGVNASYLKNRITINIC